MPLENLENEPLDFETLAPPNAWFGFTPWKGVSLRMGLSNEFLYIYIYYLLDELTLYHYEMSFFISDNSHCFQVCFFWYCCTHCIFLMISTFIICFPYFCKKSIAKEIWMVIKLMKRCSPPLEIRDIENKAIRKYTFPPGNWLILKLYHSKCWQQS